MLRLPLGLGISGSRYTKMAIQQVTGSGQQIGSIVSILFADGSFLISSDSMQTAEKPRSRFPAALQLATVSLTLIRLYLTVILIAHTVRFTQDGVYSASGRRANRCATRKSDFVCRDSITDSHDI